MQRRDWLLASLALLVILGLRAPVVAQQGSISIELNKLEAQGSQCRAYFVINNKNSTNYQELKLDLVLFLPDGVIGRRFAIDLAPLNAHKRTVKLFELADIACDQVGSLLINEVLQCKAETGPIDDCLKEIEPSSLTKAQLTR
jgi:hypothetical protein